ncbi:MAG: ATP-binding protein, partial [Spirochaetaceae bacterium]
PPHQRPVPRLAPGPRQVGKTTLAKEVMKEVAPEGFLFVSGEDPRTSELLASQDLKRLKGPTAGYGYVLLDEAQYIPNAASALKRLYDNPDKDVHPRMLVTGSSSLSPAAGTREALTGRTWSYELYPIAFRELAALENPFELEGRLPEALVLGTYPALFSLANRNDRVEHLYELVTAYLYRDVLELGSIKSSRKLRDLLRLPAYKVGSEVSYQEISRQLGMSADTVISYIDLLEQAYVVFRLGAFSRNRRKEISKKDKVYFYDNGVRNTLIEDTKEWHIRGDHGALWENFLVAERLKANAYARRRFTSHFRRVYSGAEIDYIEEREGALFAYEFRLQKKRSAPPPSFPAYPSAQFTTIDMENWLPFVTE